MVPIYVVEEGTVNPKTLCIYQFTLDLRKWVS